MSIMCICEECDEMYYLKEGHECREAKVLKRLAELEGMEWDKYDTLVAREASARTIMQKFVDKVDSGLARSTETYAEMKEWLDA